MNCPPVSWLVKLTVVEPAGRGGREGGRACVQRWVENWSPALGQRAQLARSAQCVGRGFTRQAAGAHPASCTCTLRARRRRGPTSPRRCPGRRRARLPRQARATASHWLAGSPVAVGVVAAARVCTGVVGWSRCSGAACLGGSIDAGHGAAALNAFCRGGTHSAATCPASQSRRPANPGRPAGRSSSGTIAGSSQPPA
jgi:hypothetical protein